MKKFLFTVGIAFSIWGGNLWAITLTWSDDNKTATLTKESGQEGELAAWLSDASHVTEIEKANTLHLAEGIHFNNADIEAINKLKGIKHLDIDAHQGSSNEAIDNAYFESIDFTDMEAYYKPNIAASLVKCNEKQVVAYPYPLQNGNELFVECNAGTGNPGFIASQEDFFNMVYGKPTISKVIVKGEINQDDVKAINQATIDIINMDGARISADLLDFSGNTSVKYILCPEILAEKDNSINTKAFTGCTNLLAACALSSDGSRLLGYCAQKGKLSGALNSSNYPGRLGDDYNLPNVKTALLAGYLNHTDINLCKCLTEINLAQALISSDDCYGDGNGSWGGQGGTLQTLTLPTDPSYTKIKDDAFSIVGLKQVHISSNVKEIGARAFEGCSNLPEFLDLVHTHIEVIGEAAFKNCKQISYIRFPESLKRIEKEAFQLHDCEVLRIPRNVEYIGTQAFQSSGGDGVDHNTKIENLKDVYFQGTEAPEVEQDAFGNAAYTGNNGYAVEKVYGKKYSTRANYINGNKWFAELHYRPDLTKEQEAKYVDLTRDYYFQDLYLGEQRHWPTQLEFNQSYGVARTNDETDHISGKVFKAGTYGVTKGYHYDGTPLTADEKKRIGIYQFVLTRNDAPIPDLSKPSDPDFPLSIKDDDWWTICLPFSLPKDSVLKIFGADTKLYTLGRVVRDQDKQKIHLYFTKDVMNGNDGGEVVAGNKLYDAYTGDGIKAWYPYVIKPSIDFGGKAAVVNNYRIEAGSERDIVVKAEDEYATIGDNKKKGIGWYYVFRGNCSGIVSGVKTKSSLGVAPQSLIYRPDHCYFMGLINNKAAFMYQSNSKEHKAFAPYTCAIMAYKYMGSTDTQDQVHHFLDDSFEVATGAKFHEAGSLMEFEDSTTPVENIDVDIVTPDKAFQGNIYNLNGQLVKENATSLDGLSRGIYIVNGKKYIVK